MKTAGLAQARYSLRLRIAHARATVPEPSRLTQNR